MWFQLISLLVLVGTAASAAVDQNEASEVLANPIRKAVKLLQQMQKKVEAEGDREKELYDKFMCYCKAGSGSLAASIAAAETKVPAVSSNIEASESKLSQTKLDVAKAQTDRSAAKASMADATAVREKEATVFAEEKAEYDANIDAIRKAVTALNKGMAGSFLQSAGAQVLRKLALGKQDMLDADRQDILAFLSSGDGSNYVPKGGEVTGILKDMGDTMAKGLAEATATESSAIESYDALMAAKTKEVAALTAAIEAKIKLTGELGISIVQMKEDLTDTQASLLEDKKFLSSFNTDCATKTSEWETRSKTRAEELAAIAETIKILNDDEALELFKKTLPSTSSSFVQLQAGIGAARARALAVLRESRKVVRPEGRTALDLLMLAINGRQVTAGGFEKIIKMIDDMVVLLKKEQEDDDNKKEYCATSLDMADDKKKATERSVEEEKNAIDSAKEGLVTLKEEIASLEASIITLDKSVAEATVQRKNENAEFKELMSSNSAAKDLILSAKNRLNKFYSPKLYKPPKKTDLSEEDRISTNMGAGAMFVEVAMHRQQKDAPPPPPETWDAYKKKSDEGTGVIAMLDLLVKDLDKEMTEAQTEEKEGQKEYEELMQDSAEKRATDSKSLRNKVAAKAELGMALEGHEEAKVASTKELHATLKYIASLHAECDWLLQYFDVRKEARGGEIDSLTKAKAVLSGASFEFIQVPARKGFLQHTP